MFHTCALNCYNQQKHFGKTSEYVDTPVSIQQGAHELH